MVEILHSLAAALVILIIWFAFGLLTLRKSETASFSLCLLVGFLLFYALSELLILPFVFLQQSFTTAFWVWLPITLGLCSLSFITRRKQCYETLLQVANVLRNLSPLGYVAIAVFVVQLLMVESVWLGSTDETYYTGVTATTLYTDTMYQVDSYTGDPLLILDLRYALSLYPIISAMFCKLLFLHPLLLMRLVFPALVLLLCYLVFYKIAQVLFENRQKFIFLFLITQAVLYFFGGFSIYVPQFFMMMRTSQGKTIFANVLLSLVVLFIFYLYQNARDRKVWQYVFLLSFVGSVFSLTSAFLLPVAMGVFCVPFSILQKDIKIFRNFLICSLPPLVFVGIYFLYHHRILFLPVLPL